MKTKNLTAPEIAASMNATHLPRMGGIKNLFPEPMISAELGIKALVGQYVRKENDGRYVDKSEVINAQRNRYTPHQGKRECARRAAKSPKPLKLAA